MIRHHPAIGQIDILLELDGDHFCVGLDDHSFEPTTNTLIFIVVMITKDFNRIADLKDFIFLWRTCET